MGAVNVRQQEDMAYNLNLIQVPKTSSLVSNCCRGAVAGVQEHRHQRSFIEQDFPNVLVNDEKLEIVNGSRLATSMAESGWSVMKRWVRKRNGGSHAKPRCTAGWRYNCANFRLRCDTIDDSGGSTQRHDDEDKCAKMI